MSIDSGWILAAGLLVFVGWLVGSVVRPPPRRGGAPSPASDAIAAPSTGAPAGTSAGAPVAPERAAAERRR